jgi:hypothetical protein
MSSTPTARGTKLRALVDSLRQFGMDTKRVSDLPQGPAGRRAAMARVIGTLATIGFLSLGASPDAQAQAGASPYRYSLPAGWTRASEGDIEMLTPQAEPAGSVQLMVLAPKPASGDFRQQFDGERAALESFWGLRAPAATPLQSGQAASGKYAAYFASYDSDGGPRYMAFLALGSPTQLALLVLVASSDEAFNRLAPQAVSLFKTLGFSGP